MDDCYLGGALLQTETILSLLSESITRSRGASALLAPGCKPFTYNDLLRQVEDAAASLHALGMGPSDVVAMVLPNGPEMAACWLSVASAAVSAPLNPAYSTAEFEFYLADLQAKALIVETGSCSPSVTVAKSMGIPVISLIRAADHAAGGFFLEGDRFETSVEDPVSPDPDALALMLHTSGSTSRPKMVPLTHANLCNSAREIAASL